MRRRVVLGLLPALLLPLVACGGGEPAQPTIDPAAALAKAKTVLDGAKAVTIDLKSNTGLPKGRNGVSAAKGTGLIDATTPKFKGSINAVISGTPGSVELISIADRSWMSFFTATFNPIDLETLGAPNPALLFRPGTGLSSMLTSATEVTAGPERRLGKEVLQTYTAKIPGKVVADLLRLGDGTGTCDAVFGILPATGELRLAEMTGPFYAPAVSTYTLVVTDYGKTVDIKEP